MPALAQIPIGSSFTLPGSRKIVVLEDRTNGSATVRIGGRTTNWSNQTHVRLLSDSEVKRILEEGRERDEELVEGDGGSSGMAGPVKKRTPPPKPDKPKGKDAFGVKLGTAAAAVNAYIFKKRKKITLDGIVEAVEGSKKPNVKSHLKRLTSDGYLKFNSKRETWRINEEE